MKRLYSSMLLLGSVLMMSSCSHSQNDSPVLDSSYFGQKAPGLTPEVFAPGIVSIDGRSEGSISFSPELDEIYFQAKYRDNIPAIYFSKLEGNKWTPIENADLTKGQKDEAENPVVSHDGKRIYFTAFSSDMSDTAIWYVNRLGHSWSDSIKLDLPVNDAKVLLNGQSANGDLHYFDFSKMKNYYAAYSNGGFPVAKEFELEPGFFHPHFSPYEDYFVMHGWNKEAEDENHTDIYVSFKEPDGRWAKPINLGRAVNSDVNEGSATITPGGKYMFFDRKEEDGTSNVYWVSTEVIEKLRPRGS